MVFSFDCYFALNCLSFSKMSGFLCLDLWAHYGSAGVVRTAPNVPCFPSWASNGSAPRLWYPKGENLNAPVDTWLDWDTAGTWPLCLLKGHAKSLNTLVFGGSKCDETWICRAQSLGEAYKVKKWLQNSAMGVKYSVRVRACSKPA